MNWKETLNHPIQKIKSWVKQQTYKDPDDILSATYIQLISLIIVLSAVLIGIVYAIEGQMFYVSMAVLEVLIYGIVIALVRLNKLKLASNLFLVAALALLSYGIFAGGGIHSSSSVLYPVILVFASLLLDRKSFIVYGLLCIASVGFIIYAENQGLTPIPYVPDPANFPLFITYAVIIIMMSSIIRSITESLQTSSREARQFAYEVNAQKAMLDRVGQAVVGCELDNTIIYWNQVAASLYGWTTEEALGKKYYDMVPTDLTVEKIEEIRTALRKGEVWSGDMVVHNREQNALHVLGSVAPLRDQNGTVTGWIGVSTDITDRRQGEIELRSRESILGAVTFAAEQFLKTPNWRENIDNVLEQIGKTINATHAYLFEDHLNQQGESVTSMRYEWTAAGYPSDLDGLHFQSSLIYQDGFEEQVERLKRGEVRTGRSSTFNSTEKNIMDELGVKSILEVPVFVNGREWGAIGFDDFENDREWSPAEVDVLKIAAGILSAAIQRQEAESAVQESERVYRQAIQAVGGVPYYLDYVEHRYTFMGDGIKDISGYSPSEITPQIWDQMERQRFPRGDMAHLTYEEADELTEQGLMRHWECDYLIVNRHGDERWVSDASIQVLDDKNVRIGVVGILQDITDRKLTEFNLRKRESLLEAVTFSAEQFLKTSDWRESIDIVLERLGRELNASHAYLFETQVNNEGVKLNSIRYEWTAPGQKPDIDNPAYQNATEHEREFKRYYEILNGGEPFVGSSSMLMEDEKKYFNEAGIKALLEVRIVVNGMQWGTIGFDDMVHEREWITLDVDVIKVAANVLGAAIKRQIDEDALKRELTERKRTELALRFSEEKFSKAFYTSPVLMTLEDDNNLFIDVNKAFLDGFGFDREDVIGRSGVELQMFTSVEDVNVLRENLTKNDGVLKDFEMQFRRKSGELGFVVLSSEKIYVDDAEYTLTSGLDITERKLTELAIQKQAARAEVLASLSQVLTRVTQDQHLVFDNVVRRCAELIGDGASIFLYSSENEFLELAAVYNSDTEAMDVFRDEIKKRPIKWNEGAYAKAIGEVVPVLIPFIPIEKLIENATPERKEYYQKLPIHSMMLAPLHAQGEVLGVIGMARHSPGRDYTTEDLTFLQDIADRSALALLNAQYYKKLEQELAERKLAEEKYRSIFDNSIDGIFQSTDDGRFISVNLAMARIYGYDSPEDMLQNINDIGTQIYLNAEQRDDVRQRLNSGERLVGYESLDYRKDGSTFWASMSAQAIHDDDGKLLFYEGTIEDVTPRKKAEEDRETLIEELAKKNAELEQFTYTVSHDLKSPLVTINGFLGYLEQDAAAGNMERLKKDTQRISEAVQKMQRLLNELLELSRIGRMMNSPEMISFNDMVVDALEIVHGRLNEKGVQIHTQPDLPLVYGDRPRLVEVIQNLIDNAAKYMGGQIDPQIEIGLRGEDTERGKLVFFVKDNGMGIEPEHHERVFGLFNKLDAKSEGTGVGLALVKRIIEFHGGRIWIESEAGKGSTFLFTLLTGPEA